MAALRFRTQSAADRVRVFEGDANEIIGKLVAELPLQGLNLALVDPFALGPLHFDTLAHLSRIQRMDIVLNFPTSDIKRNLQIYCHEDNEVLDRALGTREWRPIVRSTKDVVPKLIELLVRQLERLGYTGNLNRAIPVTNSKEGELYRLMLLSKRELADNIWRSITKNTLGGQRGFGGPGWD